MWRLAAQVLGKGAGYNKGRSVPFNGPGRAGHRAVGRRRPGHHARDRRPARRWRFRTRARTASASAPSATARPIAATSTRASTWRRAGNCRSCTSARTTAGRSRSRPTAICRRRSSPARRATASPACAVDGNDVEAVRAAVGEAVARARRGEGPTPDRGAHLALARPLGWRRRRPTATGPAPTTPRTRSTATRDGCSSGARPTLATWQRDPRRGRGRGARGDGTRAGRARRRRRRAGPRRGVRVTRRRRGRQATRRLTQTEAIIEAIAQEMRRDERVFYIGQDVGAMGGSLQGTQGLCDGVRAAPHPRGADLGVGDGRRGASARRCSAGDRSSRSASASSCPRR